MNIIPIKFTFYHGQYQTGSWPQPQSCPAPQLSAPLLPCTRVQPPTALELDKDRREFSPKPSLHPYLTQQVSASPALSQPSAPRTGPYRAPGSSQLGTALSAALYSKLCQGPATFKSFMLQSSLNSPDRHSIRRLAAAYIRLGIQ